MNNLKRDLKNLASSIKNIKKNIKISQQNINLFYKKNDFIETKSGLKKSGGESIYYLDSIRKQELKMLKRKLFILEEEIYIKKNTFRHLNIIYLFYKQDKLDILKLNSWYIQEELYKLNIESKRSKNTIDNFYTFINRQTFDNLLEVLEK